MKHDSPHPWGESPSFPAVCGTVRGGMATEIETTPIEIRDNAYGTIPVFSRCLRDGAWWDWPEEALLADFAEKSDRVEQADQALEDSADYAALYFVS